MADNKLLGASGLYFGSNEISKAYIGSTLVWEKGIDYSKEYFTIQSLVDNNIITLTKYNQSYNYTISDKLIKYSKDLNTWTDISFVSGSTSKIVLNSGEKLYLKGNNSTYGRRVQSGGSTYYAYAKILSSGNIDVMGNIMSLVYGDNFINNNTIESSYTFLGLFHENKKLVNAKDLILPATTLSTYCYCRMFYNCSSLTTAPELPATTLTLGCYYMMFDVCSSLTTAPELPATTLVLGCYSYMFENCSKINYIKAMFTTTPSSTYTDYWLNYVSSTGTFVKNSAATWNVRGVNGIPSGWTVQTASS